MKTPKATKTQKKSNAVNPEDDRKRAVEEIIIEIIQTNKKTGTNRSAADAITEILLAIDGALKIEEIERW